MNNMDETLRPKIKYLKFLLTQPTLKNGSAQKNFHGFGIQIFFFLFITKLYACIFNMFKRTFIYFVIVKYKILP